ncbi:hypothetical protein F7725_027351 [Dissostichus mawsoni]|uniref:U6 snRNA-associated Sm-like protein LSm7 n=1 Tax=Dissostichus mawsoni TaxID=36200 RepID=A0A7J5XD67_DISMA|nr:hypothetical protein F7725_027351 [Dissostichus mawsoni]
MASSTSRQVNLPADGGAAAEELPVQTLFILHRPLVRLHVKTQRLASKQVEGPVEFCGDQMQWSRATEAALSTALTIGLTSSHSSDPRTSLSTSPSSPSSTLPPMAYSTEPRPAEQWLCRAVCRAGPSTQTWFPQSNIRTQSTQNHRTSRKWGAALPPAAERVELIEWLLSVSWGPPRTKRVSLALALVIDLPMDQDSGKCSFSMQMSLALGSLLAAAKKQSPEVRTLEGESLTVHIETLSFYLQNCIRDHFRRRDKEKKKKESIFDLSKYIDKPIRVKFQGGREGFDPLLNLVLDGTIEYMRDPDDQLKLTEDTRQLGLVVCRGTSVVLICPQDGMESIPNPFVQQQDG